MYTVHTVLHCIETVKCFSQNPTAARTIAINDHIPGRKGRDSVNVEQPYSTYIHKVRLSLLWGRHLKISGCVLELSKYLLTKASRLFIFFGGYFSGHILPQGAILKVTYFSGIIYVFRRKKLALERDLRSNYCK